MRDDFTSNTKARLAMRVTHQCSNPQCRRITTGAHSDPAKAINVGVAAHITAASPGGPRYDQALNSAERRCIENGIWLCQTCAKLVDNDKNTYTVGLLRSWKELAELTASRRVDGSLGLPGELAQIGANELLPGDEMEVVVMARLISELDRVDIGILVYMASCYTTALERPEGTEHGISRCMPIVIDNDDGVGYTMVEKDGVPRAAGAPLPCLAPHRRHCRETGAHGGSSLIGRWSLPSVALDVSTAGLRRRRVVGPGRLKRPGDARAASSPCRSSPPITNARHFRYGTRSAQKKLVPEPVTRVSTM